MRHDPFLLRTYSRAGAVLGVAPYVANLLNPAHPRRFEVISELGIDALASKRPIHSNVGPLQLLHVGRGVRTKGLRDVVRAIAKLPADVSVHLSCAGQGPEIAFCREEAARLDIADRITFHGQIPRDEVEALYRKSQVFVFPSFREPSGSVIFEALRNGLPVITCNVGGPGFVVDRSCGITLDAINPRQLADDLAGAICALARDSQQCASLGEGAMRRAEEIGLWENKIDWLMNLYDDISHTGSTLSIQHKEVVQHA